MDNLPEKRDTEFPIRMNPESLNIETLISLAIQHNTSVENLERLLAMREKLKAEFAREEFYKALAEFQSQCPTIMKRKRVTSGTGMFLYAYAPLEDIVAQVKDLLKQCGFSYTFRFSPLEERFEAICIVYHVAGHAQETPYAPRLNEGPRNRSGDMLLSRTQQDSATITTAMRRAFSAAFGIMTGEEDFDSQKQREEGISKTSIQRIQELLKETRVRERSVLDHYNVNLMTELTETQAHRAIQKLEKIKNAAMRSTRDAKED